MFQSFCLSKNCLHKRGTSRFSFENVLSHCNEKLCEGALLYFRKLLVLNFFWIGGGGSPITTFCRNFVVSQHQKNRIGTILCFIIFLVSKYLKDERTWRVSRVSVDIFCLLVLKLFEEEPSSVSEIFWYQKLSSIFERGGYHSFPSKLYCLTVLKKS